MSHNAPEQELLLPEDLAAKLRMSRRQVIEGTRIHNWAHVRIGKRIRFTPEQADLIIRKHTTRTPLAAVPAGPEPVIGGQTGRSRTRNSKAS